jgi:hypothetical protein
MMREARFSKSRARLEILSELMSFPTINDKDWGYNCGCDTPQVGDLVAMQSAPPSKWYLSWLKELKADGGWQKYLLESIEDGELVWWENIGLTVYSREKVASRPHWKWDDSQFKFNSRWMKVCRDNDAYIVLPCQSVFNDDGSVTLDVRIRFRLDNYRNPCSFSNWRKLTIKQMDAYFKKSVAKYKAQQASNSKS